MKILICQINPIIGDIDGNKQKILKGIRDAKAQSADLVVFPEMALTGYPPQDLLLRSSFIKRVETAVREIQLETDGIHALIGLPRRNPNDYGKPLFNSCAIFDNQHSLNYYDKMLLPTYDVFDERRYFEPGTLPFIFDIKGKKIAITICEDLWEHGEELDRRRYSNDPIHDVNQHPIDLLVNLSASPYFIGKMAIRKKVARKAAETLSCPVLLVNQVGANDTLIFDGASFLISPSGETLYELPSFQEAEGLIDLENIQARINPMISPPEELFQALTLGLKDFCKKLGMKKVILGLSGGIDSALVAAIAVKALGQDNVIGVLLPSRYTSLESNQDAETLANQLGIKTYTIPIETPHEALLNLLGPLFEKHPQDTTEENIQSRLRGVILMALSNKFSALLLNTGNKSEYAVGYATLYGDMCGALSVIGDLTKREVYSLSKHLKLPQAIIDKAPTAELRPGQKDSDSLPPYPVLDLIVAGYIEENLSPSEIAEKHHLALEVVEEWTRRIDLFDFKRHQAPPILKVTSKSLSYGRHFPIIKKLS